jgi:hypothetical protein
MAPFTITPSNLVMGTGIATPSSNTTKTPSGLLGTKSDQTKLFAPVAFSPINKNSQ